MPTTSRVTMMTQGKASKVEPLPLSEEVRRELARSYEEHESLVRNLKRRGAYVPGLLARPWGAFLVENIEKIINYSPAQPSRKQVKVIYELTEALKAVNEALKAMISSQSLLSILRKAKSREPLTPSEIAKLSSVLVPSLNKHHAEQYEEESSMIMGGVVGELSSRRGQIFEVTLRDKRALRFLRENFLYYDYIALAPGRIYLISRNKTVAYILKSNVESTAPFQLLLGPDKNYLLRIIRETGSGEIKITYKGMLPKDFSLFDTVRIDTRFVYEVDTLYSRLSREWGMLVDGRTLRWLADNENARSIEFYSTGTISIGMKEGDPSSNFVVDDRFIINGRRLILEAVNTTRNPKSLEEINIKVKSVDFDRIVKVTRGPILIEKATDGSKSLVVARYTDYPLEALILQGKNVAIRTRSTYSLPDAVLNPATIEYARPEYIPLRGEPNEYTASWLDPASTSIKGYVLKDYVIVNIKRYYGWEVNNEGVSKNRTSKGIVAGSLKAYIKQRRYNTSKSLIVNIGSRLHPVLTDSYNVTVPIYLVSDGKSTYPGNDLAINDRYLWKGETGTPPYNTRYLDVTIIGIEDFNIKVTRTRTIRPIILVNSEAIRVGFTRSQTIDSGLGDAVFVSEFKNPALSLLGLEGTRASGFVFSPLVLYSNMVMKKAIRGKVYYGVSTVFFHVFIELDRGSILDYTLYGESGT